MTELSMLTFSPRGGPKKKERKGNPRYGNKKQDQQNVAKSDQTSAVKLHSLEVVG